MLSVAAPPLPPDARLCRLMTPVLAPPLPLDLREHPDLLCWMEHAEKEGEWFMNNSGH